MFNLWSEMILITYLFSSVIREKLIEEDQQNLFILQKKMEGCEKSFQRNRVEPIGVSAEPDPEPLSVPDPDYPEPEPQVDLDDVEPSCIPGPDCPEPEPQVDQMTHSLCTVYGNKRNVIQLEQ